MTRTKNHNRKLGLLAADMVVVRFKTNVMEVLQEVRDEAESLLIKSVFFKDAPFEWITLSLRFGLKNENKPHYDDINRKYGDLPLAIELDTHELQHASREELKQRFMIAVLKVLVDVAQKYSLPGERFAQMLKEAEATRENHA